MRNRTDAAASNTNVDHSWTAPKARMANIRVVPRPAAIAQGRPPGSRSVGRSRSMESVVLSITYDESFNFANP